MSLTTRRDGTGHIGIRIQSSTVSSSCFASQLTEILIQKYLVAVSLYRWFFKYAFNLSDHAQLQLSSYKLLLSYYYTLVKT